MLSSGVKKDSAKLMHFYSFYKPPTVQTGKVFLFYKDEEKATWVSVVGAYEHSHNFLGNFPNHSLINSGHIQFLFLKGGRKVLHSIMLLPCCRAAVCGRPIIIYTNACVVVCAQFNAD